MRVAILGAGPIGLMCALAVERNGHEPVIFANTLRRSMVNSDMFLMKPMPSVNNFGPDEVLRFSQKGTSIGYAKKCYGDGTAPVSWDKVSWGPQPVWWLTDTYYRLFERMERYLVQRDIDFIVAGDIAREYQTTFSTLPAQVICGDLNHTFSDVKTFLVRYPTTDHRATQELVYNGDMTVSWFRHSCIRGWRTWEYAEQPPEEDLGINPTVLVGKKVMGTTCDCHPAIHRVGRWAQYQRGILNHHAFELTTGILATEGLGKEGA